MSSDGKNKKYVSSKKARDILGVHIQTLYNWEKAGKIDTIRTGGGHRMYNVDKYLETYGDKDYNYESTIKKNSSNSESDDDEDSDQKMNICYVRVSALGQKDDLQRQKKYMKDKYPTYTIIEDIGSGINFNRRGLRMIIKYAIAGKINRLVVAYKDRLSRFGYELIRDLIKEYSNGEIVIEDEKETKKQPKEELVEDVLQILNVYTAKMNGLRKYSKKNE